MNELNYGSLEACQRLVEKGIVLKTEMFWVQITERTSIQILKGRYQAFMCLPAPSMAEVWRELPQSIFTDGKVEFLRMAKSKDDTLCTYENHGWPFQNINPTDALIDLLIWVKIERTKK